MVASEPQSIVAAMAQSRIVLGRDRGLAARMTLTVLLLGLVYVVFFVVLVSALRLGVGLVLAIVGALLVVQYWTSDKLALAASGARLVSADQAPQLHAVVQRLCMTAGLPMPRLAIVPTDLPNAFATGRDPRHAVVAVTQGLLDRLEPQELEGVLAHELTHVIHRDVAVMTIASFFAMVAGMITRFGFYFGAFGGFGGRRDRNSQSALFVVLLVSVVVYMLSFLLIRTLSRYREFAADRGAAVITKQPSALASALVKITGAISRIPQQDLRMAEGLNQFFIVHVGVKQGLTNLFSDHPPLEARLEQLRRLERELEAL
jgi:heat shock protein HtpX